jgi:hypothetical protein
VNLSPRDRRALMFLVPALLVFVIVQFWPESSAEVPSTFTPAQAEKRLASLRRIAAGLPEREQIRDKVRAELAAREAGLIEAETMAQAQARMLQVVRRVLSEQQPAVSFRAGEMGQPKPVGDHYVLTTVTVTLECGIEQAVNLLADLGAQPELIATQELQFGAATNAQKNVPLRLTLGALVPRKLLEDDKKNAGGPA